MNKKILIVAGLILFAAMGWGGKVYYKKRGLRNNNAGNIRKGADWLGLDPNGNDSAFAVFISPEYGIRALAKVIHNYQARYGINTIRGLITRYAPSSENDTKAYIDSVASSVGVSADAPIVFDNLMMPIVKAIIYHENGEQPYSDALLAKGIGMAGIKTA